MSEEQLKVLAEGAPPSTIGLDYEQVITSTSKECLSSRLMISNLGKELVRLIEMRCTSCTARFNNFPCDECVISKYTKPTLKTSKQFLEGVK